MPSVADRTNAETLTIRLERKLKEEFISAAKTERRPASDILRHLMADYVESKEREQFVTEARRQSAFASESPDEIEVMLWIENVADTGTRR